MMYVARVFQGERGHLEPQINKFHICFASNKAEMKLKGINMELDWEKHPEEHYQSLLAEGREFTIECPEGLTERRLS